MNEASTCSIRVLLKAVLLPTPRAVPSSRTSAGIQRSLTVDLHIRALNMLGEKKEGEDKQIEIPPHSVLSTWVPCSHPPGGWNKTNQRQEHLFTSRSCPCFTFMGYCSPACITSGQIVLQGHLNSKLRSHGHFKKRLTYCLCLTGERKVAQDTKVACSWARWGQNSVPEVSKGMDRPPALAREHQLCPAAGTTQTASPSSQVHWQEGPWEHPSPPHPSWGLSDPRKPFLPCHEHQIQWSRSTRSPTPTTSPELCADSVPLPPWMVLSC